VQFVAYVERYLIVYQSHWHETHQGWNKILKTGGGGKNSRAQSARKIFAADPTNPVCPPLIGGTWPFCPSPSRDRAIRSADELTERSDKKLFKMYPLCTLRTSVYHLLPAAYNVAYLMICPRGHTTLGPPHV